MNEQELKEQIEKLDERITNIDDYSRKERKSIYERLNNQDIVNTRTEERYNQILESMAKMDAKLTELAARPQKRWDGIINTAISVLIGALIGYLLVQIGLK